MYLELKPTYNNRNSVEWKNRMRKTHKTHKNQEHELIYKNTHNKMER